MRFKDNESGQTLAITALCMVGFLGFVALGVDVGVLFHTRWEMQTAADAAATAAAVEYLRNGYSTSGAITVGTAAATANNVNDGNTMSASVTVNANSNSPTSHKGCVGTNCYFEAIVSKPNPTVFYRGFVAIWKGTTSSAFTVAARAVAGTPGTATGCMYLTNPTGTVFHGSGNYSINATGCGLYVNSSSSSAMTQNGNKGSINVASVSSVGPASGLSGVNFSAGTVQTAGVIPQTVPFTNLTPPTPTGCVTPAGGTLTAATGPGCYNGNVSVGGGVTLQAGTYIINTGNLTITGSVTGHNVAFYIASNTGTFTVNPGNATIDLTPPTSGVFNAVSLYMPYGNKTTIGLLAGSSSGGMTGFIVAPGATFSMQDHGGSMTIGGLVVDNIDNGPAVLNLTGYSATSSPLKTVSLVE